MGVRTTNDGVTTGQTGRFTVGQPDGLNTPASGSGTFGSLHFNAGLPPIVWITGGGTPASTDPHGIGMDDKLNGLTDSARGYSIGQPNARWALGAPGSTGSPPGTPGTSRVNSPSALVVTETAINNCVTWMRAHLGCTMDPPILIGVSNGWVCSIIYARDNPVSAVVGLLTVTAGKDGFLSDDAEIRGLGVRERMEDAWHASYPTLPTDPKFSPYDDIASYPNLKGKVQAWYSCNDPLFAPQQMSFLQRPPIYAEMHNVGDYGHLGVLTLDASLVTPEPVLHASTTEILRFIDDIVDGL